MLTKLLEVHIVGDDIELFVGTSVGIACHRCSGVHLYHVREVTETGVQLDLMSGCVSSASMLKDTDFGGLNHRETKI
jgi:hypothetical protein